MNLRLILMKNDEISQISSTICFDKGVVVTGSKEKRHYIEVEDVSLSLTKNKIKVHNGFIL